MRIADIALIPYEIEVEEKQHILIKVGSNKDGERKEEVLGYYTSNNIGLESCIKTLVKDSIISANDKMTLSGYIAAYIKGIEKFSAIFQKALGN